MDHMFPNALRDPTDGVSGCIAKAVLFWPYEQNDWVTDTMCSPVNR